ncbi:MAG: hydantoinase B/oxoprolinase family protein [Candidatus Eisenbacteria bacterium]|nr:hydantoinase B/oxoprolinase family protein [Candidatus Eisenbacteria bacterium]
MKGEMDPMRLEILWTRLTSMVDEAATALVRTAFSAIVRDANDYGCALFDAEYNLLAQSTFGTPGFLGALPIAMKIIGRTFPPEMLRPGDVLIANDPWICTGHLNDITVVTPIYFRGRPVAYSTCTAHEMDIGGRIAIAETREVFEEGLFIPILKLYEEGHANETLFKMIRANVRVPDYVIGDLRAQLAANDVMASRLCRLLEEYNMEDVQELSCEIISRTEATVRRNISQLPEGTYSREVMIDKFDEKPITIAIAVKLKDGEVVIDYTGSSPQISRGVNVCFNYTRSYTTFAVKCAVSPLVPNNEGGLRPIKVIAPEGSILNARFPAPVNSRTNVGQFLPEIVFGTLAPLTPDRVIAGCGGAPIWAARFTGQLQTGRQFMIFCVSRGGLGARPTCDGVSTLAFPSNTVATPVEIVEGDAPVIYEKKELIQDSAGAGKYRGGFGQHVVVRVLDGDLAPASHVIASVKGGRLHYPVPGLLGGKDAPKGVINVDGETFQISGQQVILKPGSYVELLTPGGGGYGDPMDRDPALVEEDIRNGLVSTQAAKTDYGVVTDERGWKVDREATRKVRAVKGG